jgi:hypothetical protein
MRYRKTLINTAEDPKNADERGSDEIVFKNEDDI